LSEQQDLDKEVLEFGQKGFAEGGDGIVVRMEIAGNVAEGGSLIVARSSLREEKVPVA